MSEAAGLRPIGLGAFAEYINVNGAERMRRIGDQYDRYTDPRRPAFLPYQAAIAGIRRSVRDEDPTALDNMVGHASDVMRGHYEELAGGMARFLERHRPTYIETAAATWSYGDLVLNVNQHFGMTMKGAPHIVFPYLKQQPLTTDGAKVVWRTLEHTRDRILPSSKILILDVRRARTFRPTTVNRSKLDCWIQSEATGYVDHWRRIAA